MFKDKRYLPPLYIMLLMTSSLATSWLELLAPMIMATAVYKSYHQSLATLWRAQKRLFFIVVFYTLAGQQQIPPHWGVLLWQASALLCMLTIAIMLQKLLNDQEIIAIIHSYLKPINKPHWAANLAVSLLLCRHYLSLLPILWQKRKIAIKSRYARASKFKQIILTLQWFTLDTLDLPRHTSNSLQLRGYQNQLSPHTYKNSLRESLFFLAICGIIMVIFSI